AQRDHYLPLKVIKEQLDAIDRGLEPATPAPRLPRSLVAADGPRPDDFAVSTTVQMTRSELLHEAELEPDQLDELEQAGLVEIEPSGYYSADAVLAARTVAELLAAGLQVRHLRSFRTAADRDADLITQLVSAQFHRKDPDARQ